MLGLGCASCTPDTSLPFSSKHLQFTAVLENLGILIRKQSYKINATATDSLMELRYLERNMATSQNGIYSDVLDTCVL